MTARGRLNSVTNGRFQVSEFNDSFSAINLKRRQSPGDPFLPVGLLQSRRSAKFRFCELEVSKAAIDDLTLSANSGQ
ncbi:hypothetical protein [Methylicorpusculum sp.]|uniref:hypothetical protein n=1 Tax=Methylicorpusculum sp. TaxID=2713644 RepID=UPI002733E54A|nr:hypothetical protein [Methylicorpusculum sp.]MDP3529368.1 hypothetical protein [Methylicorpusculum sp.]